MSTFSRVLGSLPKKIAAAAIIAVAAMLPIATSAADAVAIEGSVTASNVSAGSTNWAKSVNATYDQVVKVQVYYHNKEEPDSNKIAQNLRVKLDMPTAAGKAQVVKGTIKADNSNTVNDQATINLDRDDASLQYIPGSATWRHNVGDNTNIKWQEDKIGDEIVTSGQGLVLENEKPCFNFAATVTVLARVTVPGVKVTKTSELASESNKWSANNTAKPGDTMKYMIKYENTGNAQQDDVIIRDSLPGHLTIVPNSTKLYNSQFPNGKTAPDDNIINGGLNAGNYAGGGGAYVTFEAKLDDASKFQCGTTTITNVGSAKPKGMSEYYGNSVTTVTKDCGTTAPTVSCTGLTVTPGAGRSVTATVDYSPKQNVTLKTVTFNWGDNTTPLTTDKTTATYTYPQDGNYNVTASLVVNVNGKDQTVTSAACAKPVSFTTPTTPTSGKGAPEALPNTGAGDVIVTFLGATLVGIIGYRLFVSRRLVRY